MGIRKGLSKIQEVSQRLRIPRHTLRFWEKELDGIIVPFRTKGGQRLYSDETISVIKEIKSLRNRGMSIAEIRAKFSMNAEHETDDLDFREIDVLANRVAQVVKSELFRFLSKNGVS